MEMEFAVRDSVGMRFLLGGNDTGGQGTSDTAKPIRAIFLNGTIGTAGHAEEE